EKLAATGVVHDRCSLEMSVGFAEQTKADRKAKTPAGRRILSENWPKMRNSAASARNLIRCFPNCQAENRLTLPAKNAGKTGTAGLEMSVISALRKSAFKNQNSP